MSNFGGGFCPERKDMTGSLFGVSMFGNAPAKLRSDICYVRVRNTIDFQFNRWPFWSGETTKYSLKNFLVLQWVEYGGEVGSHRSANCALRSLISVQELFSHLPAINTISVQLTRRKSSVNRTQFRAELRLTRTCRPVHSHTEDLMVTSNYQLPC